MKNNRVDIGGVIVGDGAAVAVQTMTNVSALDTQQSVDQIERIRKNGCRIVRISLPTMRDAENLPAIIEELARRGIDDIVLVADVHFTPKIAIAATQWVDKVRINPGNYNLGDGENLSQLIQKCKAHGVALRVGVNHGSLSAAAIEKWGDTPLGMVESALEFLRACLREEFDQVVVSLKASNVRIMVEAYRLLAERMADEGLSFPLHLGVTEAGSGAEGRVKSAVGIGTLLSEGLGDTIRVSLTEPPENEIPVAQKIIEYSEQILHDHTPLTEAYVRRTSNQIGNFGGEARVALFDELDAQARGAVASGEVAVLRAESPEQVARWWAEVQEMCKANETDERHEGGKMRGMRDMRGKKDDRRPTLLHRLYTESNLEHFQIRVGVELGGLLLDGVVDGVRIENKNFPPETIRELGLMLLQATRIRMSRAEFIACPGCGRTLFELERTLESVKERMGHLSGVKIAVMGCIVNGLGEMADADYGYVGEGAGRVTLYRNREVVARAIPESEALERLEQLIKESGDWG